MNYKNTTSPPSGAPLQDHNSLSLQHKSIGRKPHCECVRRRMAIAELDITYGAALAPSGFHRVTQLSGESAELNKGAAGSSSYLWWREGDGRLDPIVDIMLVEREEDVPAGFERVPRNIYTVAGKSSFVCFQRDKEKQPLDDIAVVYGDCSNIGI